MTTAAEPEPAANLAPELVDLLTELARAVQRYAMYPEGHPARTATVEQCLAAMMPVLESRTRLVLRINRDSIEIGDRATDPGGALLANFAGRLYEHQLGELAINSGLTPDELTGLLAVVSLPAGRGVEPLGNSSAADLKKWPHIELLPITFEGISLSRDRPSGRVARGDEPTGDLEPPAGSEEIAAEPDSQGTGEDSGELDVRGFPALTRLLQGDGDSDPEEVRREVSRLILNLDPRTLNQLTAALPAEMQAEGLEGAVTRAAANFIAAAAAGEEGNEHSAQMLRILTKLGMSKETPDRAADPESVENLTELMSRLGSDWSVEDATPQEYKEQLQSFSRQAPILSIISTWMEEPTSGRIVQMGLELNQISPPVHYAATSMIRDGHLEELLDILETTPESVACVDEIWDDVLTRDTVRTLVEPEPPAFSLLDRLLSRLEEETIEPLFDLYCNGRPPETRTATLERLVTLAENTGPMAVRRLDDERGSIRRDMLILIGHLPDPPEDFSPVAWLVDPEVDVRREAIRLALAGTEEREIALASALNDSDSEIVLMGLEAAATECPPEIVPAITSLIETPRTQARIRLAAIRALAATDTPETLHFLIRMTWVRKLFFFRTLAPKSADMLEALSVLARGWSEHAEVQRVLSAARKSKDPQIRAVVARAETGS